MTFLEARSLRAAALRRVAALLAFGALLAIVAVPTRAEARPLYTGITNLGDIEPVAFQRARAAGAQFVRIPLDWELTAPPAGGSWSPDYSPDPNYRWKDTDDAVIRAVQAGLVPVLQVDGAPKSAQRCQTPAVLPSAICDPDPAALAAFAGAAARRYSGNTPGLPRVQYWQALNEPNLSLFFFPQFNTANKTLSPGLYRTLINSFYMAVKSVDKTNLVLLAGLGPVAVPKWTIGPMRFTRQLLCMTGSNNPHPTKGTCGGGVHFDIFAIQPYTTGGPAHEGRINDVQIGDLPKLRGLIDAADRAGRIKGRFRHTPLWVTEFSWDSNPPDPGGLPMRTLSRWAAVALYTAWKAGVSHFFWYSLRDGKHEPGQSYKESLESGLYFRGATVHDDQPKEVLQAFRFPFVALRSGKNLSFWGRTPTSRGGKVVVQFLRGGRWRKARVVRADKHGIFQGKIASGYGRNGKGEVRAFYWGATSVPFATRPIEDFRHAPFG